MAKDTEGVLVINCITKGTLDMVVAAEGDGAKAVEAMTEGVVVGRLINPELGVGSHELNPNLFALATN